MASVIDCGDVIQIQKHTTAFDCDGVPVSIFAGHRMKVIERRDGWLDVRSLSGGPFAVFVGEELGLPPTRPPVALIHSDNF